MDFSFLTKFFTYSSIQVKIIATILAFFMYWVIKKLSMKFVNKVSDDIKIRYQWKKTLGYIGFILFFIIIGRIWFKGIESIATYFGLVSAGIAIALKDPITNVVAWFFILSRNPFDIGERIQIGDYAGDVIDINVFKFTLLEIGNWVDGDQSTGRIVHIPNGQIFTKTLANYGKGFKYIWHEIPVLLTFESDWKKAKEILNQIVMGHAAHISKAAEKRIKKAKERFLIYQTNLEPAVYTKVEDSGVLLTVRYLCNPRKRRNTEQAIWEEILTEFANYPDIDFAYPTTRFYKNDENL
jgi:small-conductance mechanosensitive channel